MTLEDEQVNSELPTPHPRKGPGWTIRYPTDVRLDAAIRRKERTAELLKESNSIQSPSPYSVERHNYLSTLERDILEMRMPASLRGVGGYLCNALGGTLVPSAHGRIEELLLTVPSYDEPEVTVSWLDARHFHALLSKLGPDRQYTVVCHSNQIDDVRGWISKVGIPEENLTLVISTFDTSIWAQDAYIAMSPQDGNTILCEGVIFTRQEDMSIADDIAAQTQNSVLQSRLFFEGGNILGTPDVALIGKDYIWWNTGRVGLETCQLVEQAFEELIGTPVLSVGREKRLDDTARQVLSGIFQPIFHIDMYVTPTGVTSGSGKEVVLVGRPSLARKELNEEPQPYDYDEYFEEVSKQLSEHFSIIELPLLPVYGNLGLEGWEMKHYHLTWNNVVIENYVDDTGVRRRFVFMPTYADPDRGYDVDTGARARLDDLAAKIWKEMVGFEVLRLDGMEDLAWAQGAVHCMTKTLRRRGF